jgi:hypothetical protein
VIFEPDKTRGLQIGLGLLVGLAALAGLAVFVLTSQPLSLLPALVLVAVLPLLAWVGWLVYGLFNARYQLSDDSLTVQWGGRRENIPLPDIEDRHLGAEFEGELRPGGLSWPGLVSSRIDHPTLGKVQFLATTADKAGLVLLGYSDGWLALSPREPAAFLDALRKRQAALPASAIAGVAEAALPDAPPDLLPEEEAPTIVATPVAEAPEIIEPVAVAAPEPSPPPFAALLDWRAWPLWRDRLALALIGAGALIVLALTVYLLVIVPQLPPQIALRFDAQRQPVQFGASEGLWLPAALAALAWLLNTLLGVLFHRREADRALAYLLFGATLFMAALAWGAILGLLTIG